MKKTNGVYPFPDPDDDDLLVELIIVDEGARGGWYGVSEDDVRIACESFNLPFDEIMGLIENKASGVHTLLINVPQFMDSRKSERSK